MHGKRGKNLPKSVREARIAAGPPIEVDPIVRARGFAPKQKRGPLNRTTVLSIFSIQINTQYRPYNLYEQEHLVERLKLTLNKVFKEDFMATFGEWAHSNWAGVSADEMVNNIEKAKYFYNVETGTPNSKGHRVHAHSSLWISHRDNISLEPANLMKRLTQTWDSLEDEAPHSEVAHLFHNGPERKWNIQMRFVRPDALTHEWWYMNKNLQNAARHMADLARLRGEGTFEEILESVHSQGHL